MTGPDPKEARHRADGQDVAVEVLYRRLLNHARTAAQLGNYGIAAALVLVDDGVRLTVFAHNTVASNDPRGHAEMNAIGLAQRLVSLPDGDRVTLLARLVDQGHVELAPVQSATGRHVRLYSTHEPCPMCTVAAINAGVDLVTYAVDDPPSGALAPQRLAQLAPLWAQTARRQNLHVQRCSTRPGAPADEYLPAELLLELEQTFAASREALDRRLAEQGFFDFAPLTADARGLMDRGG